MIKDKKTFFIKAFVFKLLIFLLPSQLAFHFWPDWSYISGIRVDYLAPTIYLTDLLILAIFATSNLRLLKKGKLIFASLLIFTTINILGSSNEYIALIRCLKFAELTFFCFFVFSDRDFNFKEWLIKPIILSVIFFSLIGIFQFLLGHSLGGVFYWLGERKFNLATLGISTSSLLNRVYLRSYSTFSHPNSLGGYMAVCLFFILNFRMKFSDSTFKYFSFIALFLGTIATMLSFSMGVIVSLIICALLIIINVKNYHVFILIVKTSIFILIISSLFLLIYFGFSSIDNLNIPENIFDRLILIKIAKEIILDNMFIGVGLNNFIIDMPKYLWLTGKVWLLQPVHNIYLLIFTETGILGLVVFTLMMYKAVRLNLKKNRLIIIFPLLFILLTGFVDHYWVTLQQNELLFSLVLGLAFRKAVINDL